MLLYDQLPKLNSGLADDDGVNVLDGLTHNDIEKNLVNTIKDYNYLNSYLL